jgi:hypothetical protein
MGQVTVRIRETHDNLRREVLIGAHTLVEYAYSRSLSAPSTWDFALLASLFWAMHRGVDLHIAGPVSQRLLLNLEEFQDAWTAWAPDRYRLIGITADAEVRGEDDGRSGAFAFSGGVDSVFTLLRHGSGKAGRRTVTPRVAVLVHGFDIPLEATDAFAVAERSARKTADLLGLELAAVKTNWRMLGGKWEWEFCSALAAVLHQFQGLAAHGVVAADEDYTALAFPWGSNPITNPMLSGSHFSMVTDGTSFTRSQRVAFIASESPQAARRLRVCWEGLPTGENCGVCEKCVRTKLNFMAGGHEPLAFDRRPTWDEINSINVRNPIQLSFLKEIQATARANGITERWVSVLDRVIVRGVPAGTQPSRARRFASLLKRRLSHLAR